MGSAVSAVSGVVGGVLGGGIKGITQNVIPGADLANQEQINKQIEALRANSGQFQNSYGQLQNQANNQLDNTMNQIGYANTAQQGAINANNVVGGDALSILRNAATGGAPSAAQAQLQSGKDQAIATQMAMANSGNLSQMIGGQKTAMDNAANLNQQSANQAAQLRATEMGTARGQYGQQAASFNAQTAQNAQNAGNLANLNANLYGTQLGAAQGYAGLQNQAQQGAGNLAVGQLTSNQGAQNQAQQQQAGAAGGMLNGIGGALSAGLMMSDERTKYNVQSDGERNWGEIKDFFTGKYGEKKKKEKEYNDRILEAQAQDGMALSDEDSKQNIQQDRGSKAKGVADFFKNENKKDEPKEESKSEEPAAKSGGYSDDDPRKKAAKSIKEGFMSDENTKKGVKKDSLLHAFLDGLDPVTFEYKDPTGEMGKTPGVHMGIIAQDVEKAPGGKSMVKDTPDGKAIDMASAMGMLMSAAADAHDRMSSLEELFKSKKVK